MKTHRLPNAGICAENGLETGDLDMMKSLAGLCVIAALAGGAITATPDPAEARCTDCGRPIAGTHVNTVYRFKTVQRVGNVTKYKDVNKVSYRDINRVHYKDITKTAYKDINRTKYVKHINRIVTVTRVQPVIRTHVVMRVHHEVVARVHNQVVARVHTKVIPRVHIQTVVLHENQHVAQTKVLPTKMVMGGTKTVMGGTSTKTVMSVKTIRSNGSAPIVVKKKIHSA
jgi:hypothetical protein